MYTSKQFKIKPFIDTANEIQKISELAYPFNKIFLADGDAMVLSTNKLEKILHLVKNELKSVRRISAYAKPKDLTNKTVDELKLLKTCGLDLVYIGIESGDDEVLKRVNKGETFDSTVEGLLKAKAAGIKLSVMILNGLGGKELREQHAIRSAEIVNEIQPEYLSTLVLSFPFGEDHFKARYSGNFTKLNTLELIEEMGLFLKHTHLKQTVFRSDHASNYLVLKGILSRDKPKLLGDIDLVLKDPQNADLRKEWQRGL